MELIIKRLMNNELKLSLAESLDRYFKIEMARSEEQKKLAYGIRYRVYCEEFKYEAVDLFPDKLEKDEYDQNSRHCSIIHRSSGLSAACVRMVPAAGPSDLVPATARKILLF